MTPKSGKIIYFLGCLCVLPISFAESTDPIHHPPLGGCNRDLICFICPVLAGVHPCLKPAEEPLSKEEMNDKKTQDKPAGLLSETALLWVGRSQPSQACSSSYRLLHTSLSFTPSPLSRPRRPKTHGRPAGPQVKNGKLPLPPASQGWPCLAPLSVPTPSHLLLPQARLLNLQFPRNFMNAQHKPK